MRQRGFTFLWAAPLIVAAALLGAGTIEPGFMGAAIVGGARPTQMPASAAEPNVDQYHGDRQRHGVYTDPALDVKAAARTRLDKAFAGHVNGAIYAQPLFWNGSRKLVIVVTEKNEVATLDATTGRTVWKKTLGPPAKKSDLPCGNIDPLGITGTPVIDPVSKTLILDAMILVGGKTPVPRHKLFRLSLEDGSTAAGWPIDVAAAVEKLDRRFVAADQNQRGALLILNDRVYVPYGGHYGDCGEFHGWVVSVALKGPTELKAWSTRGRGGGIWAPGGLSTDGTSIFASTGNTIGVENWSDGQAVIRLSPDLVFSQKADDYFTPPEWRELDQTDLDLGGTNPIPFDLNGSRLVLAMGKNGKAYLLDRDHLGGIGNGLQSARVSAETIRTAPALLVLGDRALVAFHGRGADCEDKQADLTMLELRGGKAPSIKMLWCAHEGGRGSPIITTTDGHANPIVWTVGSEDSNQLRAFDAATGKLLFESEGKNRISGEVRRFVAPILAAGKIYVPADDRIYAFRFQ